MNATMNPHGRGAMAEHEQWRRPDRAMSIHPGQPLGLARAFEIDPQADHDYLAARNALDRAQRELEQVRALLASGATAPRVMARLQGAEQAVAEAEAVVGVMEGAVLYARYLGKKSG